MKFLKRRTLSDLASSLKDKILKSTPEDIKYRYNYIIDDEYRDLNTEKIRLNLFNHILMLCVIVTISSFIFLLNKKFEPVFYFSIVFSSISMLFNIIFNYYLSKETIKKYEKLLSILRNSNDLFNNNSETPKIIINKIDDLSKKIDNNKTIDNNKVELYDTRDIVIILDILDHFRNETSGLPRINNPQNAHLISKITGCSEEQFKKFTTYPYIKKPQGKQKDIIINRLEAMRKDFKKIEPATTYIEYKIEEIKNNVKKINS